MVAKITYGSSIYGAVSYNQQKVDDGQAKVIHTHKMIQNLDGVENITFNQTLRSFEDYLSANQRTKKPVAHFSLNPAPQDKLNDEKLSLLADDYMEKMGYKDQPYIVYKHSDIDREHIHIVTVRVDENGRKISDSKDFKRNQDICRELESKYNLKKIGNKKQEESIYYLRKVDYNRGDVKRQISNTVKSLLSDYKFQTFGEFNALLSCYNIHCKQVKGEEQGHVYNGIIYCATNDKGELQGNPIKSSLISKSVGYDAINKILGQNTISMKNEGLHVEPARTLIMQCIRNCKNKSHFTELLKKGNMDTIFRQNEQGRIYGVTFIDHNEKMVYNGSRLGKEFSANYMNKLFNELPESRIPENNISQNDWPELESRVIPQLVDEIFGEFYLHYYGNDPQEDEFRRRMQKRKRKIN